MQVLNGQGFLQALQQTGRRHGPGGFQPFGRSAQFFFCHLGVFVSPGAAQAPAGIIAAAAIEVAALRDRYSSKRIRADRKCAGDQNAGAVRNILKETVLDAVADSAIDAAGIGKPRSISQP